MRSPITILAIDPGYDRVGWAVGSMSGLECLALHYGLIQTKKSESRIGRYQHIDRELSEIMTQYQPQEAAIESLFFYNNKTTAIHVAEARGVIISSCFRHEVEVSEYTPLQIKQAVTGFGQADKKAVEKMVRLQLKKQVANSEKMIDDTLDALAILLTHAARRTSGLTSL